MAEFTIGQVEQLTGLKAHVLRYWEECIPYLKPRKDNLGRRLYSVRDIQIIQRLQYLVQERKFTIEGAGETFLQEAESLAHKQTELLPILQEIHTLREQLMDIYTIIHKESL